MSGLRASSVKLKNLEVLQLLQIFIGLALDVIPAEIEIRYLLTQLIKRPV